MRVTPKASRKLEAFFFGNAASSEYSEWCVRFAMQLPDRFYILPFDHRRSFARMFGFDEKTLDAAAREKLIDYKHLVFEGLLKAIEIGVPKVWTAILVDEKFGSHIHEEARALGITRLLTVEKSGQEEFDFEYGNDFGAHIEKLKPDYVKALVRYNPSGDTEMNRRQRERLRRLGDFCRTDGYGFLIELLTAPTPGDAKAMQRTIQEFHADAVEPDVWKLEGLTDRAAMEQVVAEARSGKRTNVGIVVLGRGEDEPTVRAWLAAAAPIPGVIGFAVGRTVFKEPLLDLHRGSISRAEAAEKIAENYKGFVNFFDKLRAT